MTQIPMEATQPLTMDDRHHPYLEIMVGETRGSATWDTGAGVTVVDTGLIEASPGNFEELAASQGTDSTGETRETPMFKMQGLQLAGQSFPPHIVAAVDLSQVNENTEKPMDMILGYTCLRLADWYFDFPSMKWGISELDNSV